MPRSRTRDEATSSSYSSCWWHAVSMLHPSERSIAGMLTLILLGGTAQMASRSAWNIGRTFDAAATKHNTIYKEHVHHFEDHQSPPQQVLDPTITWTNDVSTSIWNISYATDYELLLDLVHQQRQELDARLSLDDRYGNYFQSLFYTEASVSRGRLAAQDATHLHVGWESMVQRLQLKIVQAQEQVLLRRQSNERDRSPSQTSFSRFPRQLRSKKRTQSKDGLANSSIPTIPWVFAVSGHSSAAGHGNFEDQSYASVLEETIAPLFSSLGISFETRNYGMSGKSSGPELALCLEAIYGIDVDVLVYDSAQTDHLPWFLEFWMQRASIHANQPILMAAHTNMGRMARSNTTQRVWDQHGPRLPLMIVNETIVQQVGHAVPNTLGSITNQNTSGLPHLLQNLKCGFGGDDSEEFLEANEPCKSQKFDVSECPHRPWRTPWHPGFRRLALYGTLLALMQADALEQAVQNLLDMTTALSSTTGSKDNPKASSTRVDLAMIRRLKHTLETQQGSLKAELEATRKLNPEIGSGMIDWQTMFPGVDPDWFFHHPSLCRTARLPSQQRYKGILTGKPVPFEDAEGLVPVEGLEHGAIVGQPMTNSSVFVSEDRILDFALGYDNTTRAPQRSCRRKIHEDFSDYFYVTGKEWRRAVLPSAAEQEEYRHGAAPYHGIVIVCPLRCYMQNKVCSGDEFSLPEHWHGLEFQVNGIAATEYGFMGRDCIILKQTQVPSKVNVSHASSNFIFPARSEHSWEIKVRIKPSAAQPISLFQINSIVLL